MMRIHFRDEHDGNCSKWRVEVPAAALTRRGHLVTRSPLQQPLRPAGSPMLPDQRPNCPPLSDIDLFVYQRPTLDSHLAEIEQLQDRFGFPVIIEVDDLFLPGALPPDNPAFTIFHPKAIPNHLFHQAAIGHADLTAYRNNRLQILNRSFRRAHAISVSTSFLAEAYRPINRYHAVTVLPNSFDDTNPRWLIPPQRPAYPISHPQLPTNIHVQPRHPDDDQIWIFFGGSFTHIGDLRLLQGAIEPVCKNYPNARLAIAGDWRILDLFHLPPEQKIFLGSVPFEDYPLLLHCADIMIAPLRDIKFNAAKSDIRLLEAGLVRCPWVASPVRPYREWQAGGIFASRPADWIRALSRLIEQPQLRQQLGNEGFHKAQSRAITATIPLWEAFYSQVIEQQMHRAPQSPWAVQRAAALHHSRAASDLPH